MSDHRRDQDRARKAAWRLRQAMTPQSERNATKRLGEIADRSGVSLSTVKRHRRAGTLDALEKGVTQKCPDVLNQKFPKQSHREVIAELHAGAKAAQDEWLTTLLPWSMMWANACEESKPTPPHITPGLQPLPTSQRVEMKKQRFSWAVKPLTRRHLPPPFMLARLVSTKKVTLPAVTTACLTDADVGLPEDPVAQQRAEEAIRAAISYQLRQDAKAKPAPVQAIEVPLDNDSLSIRDVPADVLDGIASELRRIASRPPTVARSGIE